MAIEIRAYRPGDERAICTLFETVFGRPMSLDYWAWRYRDHPSGGPLAELCWDGERLDSPDHRSHLARSERGRCPASHPVHVPQLEFAVQWPFWGDPANLRLASGPLTTAHADFFNAWDPERLAVEVEHCIGLDAVCGVPSF